MPGTLLVDRGLKTLVPGGSFCPEPEHPPRPGPEGTPPPWSGTSRATSCYDLCLPPFGTTSSLWPPLCPCPPHVSLQLSLGQVVVPVYRREGHCGELDPPEGKSEDPQGRGSPAPGLHPDTRPSHGL